MNPSICAGVDGTSTSRSAIIWAMNRASRTGSSVTLVHVIDDEWGTLGERSMFEVHPAVDGLVSAELEFARGVSPNVTVTARIMVGDPMVELSAASRDAEMVVVGTHKTGFLRGRTFGSRSIQLAAMASCPLAVIPEYISDSHRGVIVGLPHSDAADAALKFAAHEAKSMDQELVIIHAIGYQRQQAARRTIDVTKQLRDVETYATRAVMDIGPSQSRVWRIEGSASQALVDAGSLARLLVVGSTRRHGREMTSLGPVCHDVLMNITCPTIVVHDDPIGMPVERLQESRTL